MKSDPAIAATAMIDFIAIKLQFLIGSRKCGGANGFFCRPDSLPINLGFFAGND
jgi:hypothetical protein